jgi:uncharacterized protein (DUF433 family)
MIQRATRGVSVPGEGGYDVTITDRIEMDPKVMLGKPVIRGTRITVELVLRKLAEGMSEAQLLDAYPRLSQNDIRAAIGYAADTLAHEDTVLTGPSELGPEP